MQGEHPNAPTIISPRWILECWQANELVDTTGYEPRYVSDVPIPPVKAKQQVDPSGGAAKKRKRPPQSNSSLFCHCLFTLLRVAPPPSAIDYNTKDLEGLILSNGGQLLTAEIAEALLVDEAAASQRSSHHSMLTKQKKIKHKTKKRKAYVVCWGGNVESNWAMHSNLGQVKHLCDWTFVTPTWLSTCMTESKLVSMSGTNQKSYPPVLFQPQPWPLQRFQGKQGKGNLVVRIAMTGLQAGSLRTAVTHLIRDMGATYDESIVRDHTTHLIVCFTGGNHPFAASAKYEKAVEWKLHIVTLDWLFHVAQYGYQGKERKGSEQTGCERNFPVPAKGS